MMDINGDQETGKETMLESSESKPSGTKLTETRPLQLSEQSIEGVNSKCTCKETDRSNTDTSIKRKYYCEDTTSGSAKLIRSSCSNKPVESLIKIDSEGDEIAINKQDQNEANSILDGSVTRNSEINSAKQFDNKDDWNSSEENRVEDASHTSHDETRSPSSESDGLDEISFGLCPGFNEDENDDNNNHSSDYDSDDSGSNEATSDNRYGNTSQERYPEVWKKSLPSPKFCFPRELMRRQYRGEDQKRRRSSRFMSSVYGSRSMVQRLRIDKKLQKHNGCVNSVTFNDSGDILISGSDDRHVCLWDWARNKNLFYFDSGHTANVFQAKFLPCSGDTHMVTCGADSQVRMSLFDLCGLKATRLIVKHERIVHKIALQPQMPNTFLSAGEDGVVYSIDIRESKPYCHKLLKIVRAYPRPPIPVSLLSVHCNPLKNHEFVVCGNDRDVRMYDQRKISPSSTSPLNTFCPSAGKSTQPSATLGSSPKKNLFMKGPTCATFNYNGSEIVASYTDDDIYLFDTYSSEEVHHYDGHRNSDSIKEVNFYGPRSEYIVSGSDCGYLYVWDKNSEAIVQWKKNDSIINCVEPHPSFPVLATSGLDNDVKIWMPTGSNAANIKDLPEFRKITRKNSKMFNAHKYTTSLRDSERSEWAVLSWSFRCS